MAITAADIKFYYSGGATGSPASSLGGSPSTTEISAGTHNLFDLVSSAEASSGESEFRCFYVVNDNISSLTLQTALLWISADTTGAPSDVELALDPTGVGGTAATVANENTSPAGTTFVSTATSEGAALQLGNIPAGGGRRAVWVKRIIPPGAAAATNTGVTFTVKGDTAA